MNTEHVKGTVNEVKGKIKEEVGHATGKDHLSVKGVAEQIVGKVQKEFGDLKDKVKEKVDHLLESKHDKNN